MTGNLPHLEAAISEIYIYIYIYITLHKSSEQSANHSEQNIAPVQWEVNKLPAGTVHQQRREIRSRMKIRYKNYEGEPAYCVSCMSQPRAVTFNELSIFNLAMAAFWSYRNILRTESWCLLILYKTDKDIDFMLTAFTSNKQNLISSIRLQFVSSFFAGWGQMKHKRAETMIIWTRC
jgi:hypothetical protein